MSLKPSYRTSQRPLPVKNWEWNKYGNNSLWRRLSLFRDTSFVASGDNNTLLDSEEVQNCEWVYWISCTCLHWTPWRNAFMDTYIYTHIYKHTCICIFQCRNCRVVLESCINRVYTFQLWACRLESNWWKQIQRFRAEHWAKLPKFSQREERIIWAKGSMPWPRHP